MRLIELIAESEALQLAIAGAAGGLVRSLTIRRGLVDAVATVLVGGVTAIYLGTPATAIASRWLSLDLDPGDTAFGGFIVGVLAIVLTGFLSDVVHSYRDSIKARADD